MLQDAPAAIARRMLHLEGRCLDRKDWKQWLALYDENAVYWVPAWRDESSETSDPDTELSLIYHDSRAGLEERIVRIDSHKSVTAMPLPRTTHFTGNVVVIAHDTQTIDAEFNWTVHVYEPRTARQHVHFGWSEVRFNRRAAGWLIARKKSHLQNDRIRAVIDFYML